MNMKTAVKRVKLAPVVVFTLACLFPRLLWGEPITLSQFITMVIQASPDVNQAKYKLSLIQAQRRQLKEELWPELTLSLNTFQLRQGPRDIYFGGETIPQPASVLTYHSASLGINQEISSYGKLSLQLKENTLHAEIERLEYLAKVRKLIIKSIRIFFELAEKQAIRQLLLEELDDLKLQARLVNSLVTDGVRPPIDKIRLKTSLNDLRLRVKSTDEQIVQYRLEIAHLMDVNDFADELRLSLPFIEEDTMTTTGMIALEELPELRKIKLMIDAEKMKLSLLRRQSWPDMTLRVAYDRSSDIFKYLVADFNRNWSITYSVALSLPVLQHGKLKLERIRRKIAIQRTEERYKQVAKDLQKQIQTLKNKIRHKKNMYHLYAQSIEQWRKIYEYEREKYRRGLTLFSELSTARRNLLRSKQDMIHFKFDLMKSQAELEVIAGKWDSAINAALFTPR